MSKAGCLIACTLWGLIACSDGDNHPNPVPPDQGHTDAAISGDASDIDAGSDGGSDAGELDAAVSDAGHDAAAPDANVNGRPPRLNVSFETAKRTHAGDASVLQDVLVADQTDFYVFSGKAGEFYELETDDTEFSPYLTMTLYDSDQRKIADNDGQSIWPGDTVDARLVVQLPRDGDYYVRLEDLTTPPEFFQQSSSVFSLLFYHLHIRELNDGAPASAHDGHDATTISFAHDDTSGYDYVTLVGTFNADGDDVFPLDGTKDHALIGHVLSTAIVPVSRGGTMTVVDKDKHVLATIDLGATQQDIDPPISEGAYELHVTGGIAIQGQPYAIDLLSLADNPTEKNDADNGTLANAEPLMAMAQGASFRALVLAQLPTNDVDYFSFQADQDANISVACQGQSAGSGVRGGHAEIRDSNDKLLGAGNESASAALTIENLQVSLSGTYYLRLSAQTPKDSAVEPWLRCALVANP
ncbi:MAG TPA: PPC domain-containing protein [Polyangiales bacterium]|nr:PPC domain-containing protein [Polyangiales bacterium]